MAEDKGEEDNTHNELTDLIDKFEALVVKVEGTTTPEESDVFIIEAEYSIKQE